LMHILEMTTTGPQFWPLILMLRLVIGGPSNQTQLGKSHEGKIHLWIQKGFPWISLCDACDAWFRDMKSLFYFMFNPLQEYFEKIKVDESKK
jgi:hypothetical protein